MDTIYLRENVYSQKVCIIFDWICKNPPPTHPIFKSSNFKASYNLKIFIGEISGQYYIHKMKLCDMKGKIWMCLTGGFCKSSHIC